MAANFFHATKTKDAQPSCDAMPTMLTSTSHSLSPQDTIMKTSYYLKSLEVGPCQEDSQKGKDKNVKKDQDQAPFYLL